MLVVQSLIIFGVVLALGFCAVVGDDSLTAILGNAQGNGALLAVGFVVVRNTFPMFILWFVVMAGLNTMGIFSPRGIDLLSRLGKYLFAAALAGVGFKIRFKDVFSKGLKPIALGGITWLCVAVSSFAFAFFFAGYIG